MPEAATLVVFGAGGQVGRALAALPPPPGWRVLALDRMASDITDRARVAACLAGVGHGVVVNLAAHTQVDRAETEPDEAFAANRDGAANIAEAAAAQDLALVHLSTDYVFPGTVDAPLAEDAPTGPLGVYGASKLAGETAVLGLHPRALVLRTSWVFGVHGMNFVKAILRRAKERTQLGVVADQVGCPTPAPAIAATLWTLAARLDNSRNPQDFGLFHYCGRPATSWYGFATAILEDAAAYGHPLGRAVPITTADYPTAARRPPQVVLDCRRLARRHGIDQPEWRPALRELLPQISEAS